MTTHVRATSHEVDGIVRRALRQDCVEAQIWGYGYQNISTTLKVPKNTVASIILKWMKFGITKIISRAGCPSKLSNQGTRVLVREVTKNPMVALTEL